MRKITECSPPEPNRGADSTHFLPIVDDGRFDPVIYDLDAKIGKGNEDTFRFDPNNIYSMHDGKDDQGCTDIVHPAALDLAALTQFVTDLAEAVTSANSSFSASSEQMVQRAYEIRYGASGTSLTEMSAALEALKPLVENVSAKTDDHIKHSYDGLRSAITSTRTALVEAVHHALEGDSSLVDALVGNTVEGVRNSAIVGVVPGVGPILAGAAIPVTSAKNLFNFFKGKDHTFPPEAVEAFNNNVDQHINDATAGSAELDAALAALKTAIDELPVPVPGGGFTAPSLQDKKDAPVAEAPVAAPTPAPADTGGGGLSEPLSDTGDDDLDKKLADLMGTDPMAGMPSDAGLGSGGGLPSGGSPLGSGGGGDMGSGMGAPLSNPGGLGDEELAKPLDDLADEEEEKPEEPLDDVSEDKDDKDEDALDDPGKIGEDEDLPEAEDPTEDKDDDSDDEEKPEEGDTPVEPEPEADPNSEEARTADVGNGRKVLFPDAALAKLAEGLASPDAEHKTLRLIASELGFEIPPDGQDIGKQVPTSLLREGDAIVGTAGEGIYIGTDEVLMEGGKIVPLSEAAVFDGQNQGIFRLDEGTGGAGGDATSGAGSADALTGVAQPVGDGSSAPVSGGTDPAVDATPTVSTPGDVNEQAGTPGVPDDTKSDGLPSTDDTAAGASVGDTDNGAGGLDPNSAFAN